MNTEVVPSLVFEQIKANKKDFEILLKAVFDWHFFVIVEECMNFYPNEEHLDDNIIYIDCDVVPTEHVHYVAVKFVKTRPADDDVKEIEINFMGTTLYVYYWNEMLDKIETMDKNYDRLVDKYNKLVRKYNNK